MEYDHGLSDVYFEASEFKMSQPTLLYGLKPYNVGTGACESLPSYISRLADEHRISVGSLLNDIIKVNYFPSLPSSIGFKVNDFLPIGDYTQSMVNALALATNVGNLLGLTLNPLRGIISSHQLLCKSARHCQLCLHDLCDNVYGQLIWNIACVTACPIHSIALAESKCGATKVHRVKAQQKKLLFGVCPVCGSIGYKCCSPPITVASPVEVWKARQVADLISNLPDAKYKFSPQALTAGLNRVIDDFAEGKLAFAADCARMHKSVLWDWIHMDRTPSLRLLLNLCLAVGVSLTSVMQGTPVLCPNPGFHFVEYKDPAPKVSIDVRERALRDALLVSPPLSLSAVARHLGLDVSALRRSFPEMAASLVNRYREHLIADKNIRIEKARIFGSELLREFKSKGLSLTARNVYSQTGICFRPKSLLYQVLKNEEIGGSQL